MRDEVSFGDGISDEIGSVSLSSCSDDELACLVRRALSGRQVVDGFVNQLTAEARRREATGSATPAEERVVLDWRTTHRSSTRRVPDDSWVTRTLATRPSGIGPPTSKLTVNVIAVGSPTASIDATCRPIDRPEVHDGPRRSTRRLAATMGADG